MNPLGLIRGDYIIFLAANCSSKLENKHDFFFCLFVAKQPFFIGTKIVH
jgi:hypothetical protein